MLCVNAMGKEGGKAWMSTDVAEVAGESPIYVLEK